MSWNQYSASSGARAQFCVFPETDGAPSRPKSEVAVETLLGKAYHAVYAKVLTEGLGSGPAHTLIDWALLREGLPLDKSRVLLSAMQPIEHALSFVREHPTSQAEVSLAYNVKTKTARILGSNLNRTYNLSPDECAGTLDASWFEALDGVGNVRRAGIRDHKCGPMAAERTDPVAENMQLRQLAHWTMLANPGTESVSAELSIVGRDGFAKITAYEHDALTLCDVDDFLLDIHDRIVSGEGPRPGVHCFDKFCPILSVCPVHQASIVKLIPADMAPAPSDFSLNFSTVEDLSCVEHAAAALVVFKVVEKICAVKIGVLKAYVDKFGPIDVGDGKSFRRFEKEEREVIGRSVQQLIQLLSKHFPEDAVRNVVHATVGMGQIEYLAKTYSEPKCASRNRRAAGDDLERAGLVARKQNVEYRIAKNKPDSPDE